MKKSLSIFINELEEEINSAFIFTFSDYTKLRGVANISEKWEIEKNLKNYKMKCGLGITKWASACKPPYKYFWVLIIQNTAIRRCEVLGIQ